MEIVMIGFRVQEMNKTYTHTLNRTTL